MGREGGGAIQGRVLETLSAGELWELQGTIKEGFYVRRVPWLFTFSMSHLSNRMEGIFRG